MRRAAAVALVVVAASFAACKKPGGASEEKPSGSATPLPSALPVGGTHKMGTTVITQAGSRVRIVAWVRGAPKREDEPGPGQVYETVGIGFCAGPDVDVSGRELVHLFSLELPNGNRVSPDSATGKLELRAKGQIAPGSCVAAPIVFQVGGGTKPAFVVFESEPVTKWKVP